MAHTIDSTVPQSPAEELCNFECDVEALARASEKLVAKAAKRAHNLNKEKFGFVTWVKSWRKSHNDTKLHMLFESLFPKLKTAEDGLKQWLDAVVERKEIALQQGKLLLAELEESVSTNQSTIDGYDEMLNECLDLGYSMKVETNDLRNQLVFLDEISTLKLLKQNRKSNIKNSKHKSASHNNNHTDDSLSKNGKSVDEDSSSSALGQGAKNKLSKQALLLDPSDTCWPQAPSPIMPPAQASLIRQPNRLNHQQPDPAVWQGFTALSAVDSHNLPTPVHHTIANTNLDPYKEATSPSADISNHTSGEAPHLGARDPQDHQDPSYMNKHNEPLSTITSLSISQPDHVGASDLAANLAPTQLRINSPTGDQGVSLANLTSKSLPGRVHKHSLGSRLRNRSRGSSSDESETQAAPWQGTEAKRVSLQSRSVSLQSLNLPQSRLRSASVPISFHGSPVTSPRDSPELVASQSHGPVSLFNSITQYSTTAINAITDIVSGSGSGSNSPMNNSGEAREERADMHLHSPSRLKSSPTTSRIGGDSPTTTAKWRSPLPLVSSLMTFSTFYSAEPMTSVLQSSVTGDNAQKWTQSLAVIPHQPSSPGGSEVISLDSKSGFSLLGEYSSSDALKDLQDDSDEAVHVKISKRIETIIKLKEYLAITIAAIKQSRDGEVAVLKRSKKLREEIKAICAVDADGSYISEDPSTTVSDSSCASLQSRSRDCFPLAEKDVVNVSQLQMPSSLLQTPSSYYCSAPSSSDSLVDPDSQTSSSCGSSIVSESSTVSNILECVDDLKSLMHEEKITKANLVAVSALLGSATDIGKQLNSDLVISK